MTYNANHKTRIKDLKSLAVNFNTKTAVLDANGLAHNALVRRKNLGSRPTDAQMAAIRNGSFTDMYIGDYWQNGSNVFTIVEFCYYLSAGSTWANQNNNNPLHSKPHVTLINSGRLYNGGTEQFAAWNTVENGYYGSAHNDFLQTTGLTIVQNIFGDENIVAHRRCISQAVADGKVTSIKYENVKIDGVTAHQLAGPWVSAGERDPIFGNKQFALAVPAPQYVYRFWGMKPLRTINSACTSPMLADYGTVGEGSNPTSYKELLVTLTLG